MSQTSVFWHRRDLRHTDNTGLYAALTSGHTILPLFIFDTDILDSLEDEDDARVTFIHDHVRNLDEFYRSKGSRLFCYHGAPVDVFQSLISRFDIAEVFTNEDYEPYARERDAKIAHLLSSRGIKFNTFTDHVIRRPGEILKEDGDPYVVYTPYMKKWRQTLSDKHLKTLPSAGYFDNFLSADEAPVPSLEALGFTRSGIQVPPQRISETTLRNYADTRDYPAASGTSRLGVHLRFGTLSIRKLAGMAAEYSETYLNELIWREFYQGILWHFPQVVTENFHRKYDALEWRNNEEDFARWCSGSTGYPLVDAGMHELNETGYMHNRVRMVTASFLTKHLLTDWRLGEAYFARRLLDYELASNNGGWQWAAGTGTDAQPYFRIFNPRSQAEKFDPDNEYIRQWNGAQDIAPMVEHTFARKRALDEFKRAAG